MGLGLRLCRLMAPRITVVTVLRQIRTNRPERGRDRQNTPGLTEGPRMMWKRIRVGGRSGRHRGGGPAVITMITTTTHQHPGGGGRRRWTVQWPRLVLAMMTMLRTTTVTDITTPAVHTSTSPATTTSTIDVIMLDDMLLLFLLLLVHGFGWIPIRRTAGVVLGRRRKRRLLLGVRSWHSMIRVVGMIQRRQRCGSDRCPGRARWMRILMRGEIQGLLRWVAAVGSALTLALVITFTATNSSQKSRSSSLT